MDVARLSPVAPEPLVPQRDDALLDGEGTGPGIRRLCIAFLDEAIAGLRDGDDVGVHSARKALKRTRAMIRLVRDPLGRWVYRQENVVLRDTARVVAPVRDAAVLIETLDGLTERYEGVLMPGAWADLRVNLVDRHRSTTRRVLGDREALFGVVTTLRTARRRFAAWPAEAGSGSTLAVPDGFDAIGDGVRRVYRRGRKAMAMAASSGTEHDFHEWRKQVKYLRHQLETIEPVWPELLRATSIELDRLGEILGAEHDLAVLDETVRSEPWVCPDLASRRALHALAVHDRTVLQHAALGLGDRLYAERPETFVRRLGSYWNAWRPRESA